MLRVQGPRPVVHGLGFVVIRFGVCGYITLGGEVEVVNCVCCILFAALPRHEHRPDAELSLVEG